MIKYFKGSAWFTAVGLVLALLWSHFRHPGHELLSIFIVLFLSILEITLSFDNAVVNAIKLEKMTRKWQLRFVTWGIAIAVFGMRLLFPLAVVSVFANLTIANALHLAIFDVAKYEQYLHDAHAPLITFGGAFLFMLFLTYFCHKDKDVHWIKPIEIPMQKFHAVKPVLALITCLCVLCVHYAVPENIRTSVDIAGFTGIVLYVLIDGLSNFLEKMSEKRQNLAGDVAKLGFTGFLYLELIDASFSLDGVLGAFAISKDIIIIMIGLAIGAMFVRSLTLYMLDSKTLKTYLYLEHGAHWAIGFLAVIMFVSTVHEIPEVVTGLTGLVIVGLAFMSSIMHNKKINEK